MAEVDKQIGVMQAVELKDISMAAYGRNGSFRVG